MYRMTQRISHVDDRYCSTLKVIVSSVFNPTDYICTIDPESVTIHGMTCQNQLQCPGIRTIIFQENVFNKKSYSYLVTYGTKVSSIRRLVPYLVTCIYIPYLRYLNIHKTIYRIKLHHNLRKIGVILKAFIR